MALSSRQAPRWLAPACRLVTATRLRHQATASGCRVTRRELRTVGPPRTRNVVTGTCCKAILSWRQAILLDWELLTTRWCHSVAIEKVEREKRLLFSFNNLFLFELKFTTSFWLICIQQLVILVFCIMASTLVTNLNKQLDLILASF